MRYTRQQVETTRRRIVTAASRRFRRDGSQGAAIATLMRDLKLTHGGFYRHFASKNQLFEAALEAAAEEMSGHMAALADAAGPARALPAIVEAYLSEAHCAHPERGCPLAALGTELTRLPRRSRDVCHRMLMAYARRLAPYLPDETEAAREERAVLLFSGMAGTLTLARTMSDPGARARLLASARTFYTRR
jgi:TetR/AcrR family transcriptional regulator, transcriptional repressor for nem operon